MRVSEPLRGLLKMTLGAVVVIAIALTLNNLANPPARVEAQTAGTVGIQAQLIPVFSGQTATACSAILKDIGQGSNILFIAQTNAGGGSASFDVEWSPTGIAPFYAITSAQYTDFAAASHVLTTNGYFPNLRSCVTYSSGTYSAWYTASSGPIAFQAPAIGSNGPTSPIVCDQATTATAANGVTGQIGPIPFNASDVVLACSLSVSFNGATSAGSVLFFWASNSGCSTGTTSAFNLYTTASTPQFLNIVTPLRSVWTSGAHSQYLCISNTSGATVSLVSAWASVHGL